MKNIEKYIQVFENVIPESLCDHIINEFENDEKKSEGKIYNNTVGEAKKTIDLFLDHREEKWKSIDSDIFRMVDKTVVDYMYFADVLIDSNTTAIADTGYRVQKYKKDEGKFLPHFDASGNIETVNRILAVIIYLNDVEVGGETNFPDLDYSIKPKKGRILIFPCHYPMLHEGCIPISGDKYILNTFIVLTGR